jgi:hypothetical protein
MRAALTFALLLLACGPSEQEAAPATEPAPAAEPEAAPEPEPLAEPEEEQPQPALGEAELDAMDRPALEAACFGGSNAACDRLGH